jgi:hypothetical protein
VYPAASWKLPVEYSENVTSPDEWTALVAQVQLHRDHNETAT